LPLLAFRNSSSVVPLQTSFLRAQLETPSAAGQAGALVIKECNNCFVTPDAGPARPALGGLPGLVNLRQMYDYTPGGVPTSSLIVENTALPDMSSFAGLRCPPGFIYLANNRGLRTLDGLGSLSYPTFSPGVTLFATGNALSGPESVQAVQTLAGCVAGGTSPQQSSMFVATAACTLPVCPPCDVRT
jgi:hypothetical protein